MEKWKSEGGEDKLKQAKKEAKKAAKAAAGGSKPKAGPKSKTSPKKKVTESSAGSGAGFKSQEFIEDSDSSSGGDKKNKGSEYFLFISRIFKNNNKIKLFSKFF